MPSAGIMASAVTAAGTDVLLEPFNNFTDAPWVLTSTPTIVAGRHGTAARLGSTAQRLAYTIPSAAESDTVTIGFAFQAATISGTVDHVLNLYSDTNATFHFDLTLANTGALTAARAANGLQTSATGVITTGTWQYIEVQVKLHDSAGQAIVRVGGAEVINFTGDTKNGGTKSVFDTVRLPVANTTSSIVHLFDDLYITTGAGAPFKGDITVP